MNRETKLTRKLAKERTAKQVERYQTKLALYRTWEKYPEHQAYAMKLKRDAEHLHKLLVVKGVL